MKMKYRIKEAMQFLFFAFYPRTTLVVEMSNNYRHNKLAWYELQDYYSAVMKYESYKQIMMQQTPHQRAEKKAYDEFVAAGGVEDKKAPKDIDYDEVDSSEPDDEETFRAQNEEFDRQMELEQRPFVSWQLSQCCLDIAESLDVLEKSIRKKPYYGMMMKHYNNCARAPLDDTISILSYEREKRRLDKKPERQKTEDSEK